MSENYSLRQGSLLASFILIFVAATVSYAAEPVAVFEAQEILGKDWNQTLVNYHVRLKRGQAVPGKLRLVDASNKEPLPYSFIGWRS